MTTSHENQEFKYGMRTSTECSLDHWAINEPKKFPKMQCICSVTRNCVFIPDENHIIERHFNPSGHEKQETKQAFFFHHVFSPEELFNTVIHELRNGLQPHGRSGNCYVYKLHFPFDVGFFPHQLYGPSFTAIVKVVCRFSVCQYCFRHCPSHVVSIYPCM